MQVSIVERMLGTKKLKFKEVSGGKHQRFHYCLPEKDELSLPIMLTVGRNSGEIKRSNLRGLAVDLGLNERQAKEVFRCHIGRSCVIIAMYVGCLWRGKQRVDRHGIVDEESLRRLSISIRDLFESEGFNWEKRLNGDEMKLMSDILVKLSELVKSPAVKELALVAGKLKDHIVGHLDAYSTQDPD